jgi:hypothetical protein
LKTLNDTDFVERFLEVIISWLKKSPKEQKYIMYRNSRYWSLRVRLPFLFEIELSDLWLKLFSKIQGMDPIWNFGDKLIHGEFR